MKFREHVQRYFTAKRYIDEHTATLWIASWIKQQRDKRSPTIQAKTNNVSKTAHIISMLKEANIKVEKEERVEASEYSVRMIERDLELFAKSMTERINDLQKLQSTGQSKIK